MSRDLLDLVRELNTLNDDNLADRVVENNDVQRCLSELQDILVEMPTLAPLNELVEALKAINNAAVAYIEGGPYENDLPGLELAMEIDRLSQDFVRPPEEMEGLK